jgi:UDP-N-acetylglucosamine--N-acetylmuramyl-(pentapeptide) pyrophosphoryl-undecaprenol N-acetylglucosamine transferase
MKIILTGGGTGGHLFPLLAVARELKRIKGPELELLFLGPINRFSKIILEENGIKTSGIMAGKWRRYSSFQNIVDIFKFPIGLVQSLYNVWKFMPDAVLAKGGYGSVPPTIAARIYLIPILTHESDAVPGYANRFLAKISDKIAVSFPSAEKYFKADKTVLVGNPIRSEITAGNLEEAQRIFGLKIDKPVLLVLGGSQGSKLINERIIEILPQILEFSQVIHQIGEGNLEAVKKQVATWGIKIGYADYHPYEFIGPELIHAYRAAELVISRAGASTVTEIAATKKPSILVPLGTSANNHQLFNAYAAASVGGALVIKEENFKGNILISKIEELINNQREREEMGQKIFGFYNPKAATALAESLIGLSEAGKVEGEGLFDKKVI